MPPKLSKPSHPVKADVAEKVKEIKLRQQKWMQQRDENKQFKPPAAATDMHPQGQRSSPSTPKKSPNLAGRGSPKHTPGSKNGMPSAKPPSGSGLKSETQTLPEKHTKFHAWLSNKKQREQHQAKDGSDNHDSGNFSQDQDYSEKRTVSPLELGSLRGSPVPSPGVKTGEYRPAQYADSVHGNNNGPSPAGVNVNMMRGRGTEQRRTEPMTERALSPNQFDALANQIVSRVKRELQLSSRSPSAERTVDDSRQSERIPVQANGHSAAIALESHTCCSCASLMTPPLHDPVLVIPCGHTLCRTCAVIGQRCQSCDQEIRSVTPNIMLQQIILDYHRKEGQPESKDNWNASISRKQQGQGHGQSDRAKHSMGQTYSQIPVQNNMPDRVQYEEDLRNLGLRCEVLEEEKATIHGKIRHLEKEKQKEKKQVENISREEHKLKEEIQRLEVRLADLGRHREQFQNKCQDLDRQKEEQQKKLSMVSQTYKELKLDVHKITLLMEDEEVEY